MADDGAALQAYYARDEERDRLAEGVGRVEYARTVEVITRTLPAPPAIVADIGGGPGRYTDWLVGAGYTVVHRDLVAHHVDQVRIRHGAQVDSEVGDATALDLGDSSVERSGVLAPVHDNGFTGFAHTPEQLRSEVAASGLALESLVCLEGIAFALADLDRRWDDPGERGLLLDSLRAVESVPDLLGLGPHLLATARRP